MIVGRGTRERLSPDREPTAGVFTGVWTAGETLGLELGPGLYALVLALGGYVSSTGGDAACGRPTGPQVFVPSYLTCDELVPS